MTGFSYLPPQRRRSYIPAFTTVAIDHRVRGPLAALAATLFLTAAIGFVQLGRLHAAQIAYDRAALGLTANEPAVREVAVLRERFARDTLLWDAVETERRTSLRHADDLIWIGNHLPGQTWLRAVRYEAGVYSLAGTAVGASAVGAAMLALHDDAHVATPQLVSLQVDGQAHTGHVQYELRMSSER